MLRIQKINKSFQKFSIKTSIAITFAIIIIFLTPSTLEKRASVIRSAGAKKEKDCTPKNNFSTVSKSECSAFPQTPAGMTKVNNFFIDRFEASVGYIDSDDNLQVWSPYIKPNLDSYPYLRSFSILGIIPQGYVDGHTAEVLCKNSGKRLCTSNEWLQACRGSKNFIYPYGDRLVKEKCNGSRSLHPAIELFGPYESSFQKIQNSCINQLENSVFPTGAFTDCTNEYSIYDMVGNLHEWVSDKAGVFRGGYYVDTQINGPGCLYRTSAHAKGHWDYSTGFRCCKSQ